MRSKLLKALAEEAVSSEPVSKSLNSLLTGKLTGKNIESGHLRPGGAVNALSGQTLTAIFPTRPEQGIFFDE
jgi:hypothetical protein